MPKENPKEEKEEKEGRPSPKERQRARYAKQLLSSVDKSYRTRKGKKIKEKIKKLEEDDPEIMQKILRDAARAKPPKSVEGGKRIFSGKSRSFTDRFRAAYWKANSLPIECPICKNMIEANGKHGLAPSIDHLRPWATIKTEIPTVTVCKDGVHWSVVLAEDMRPVLQDEKNLRPAHQGCNSGKNGPKNTDSIAPQRLGRCPGEDICKELKGR
jgi:hypothetical protein